ncbi:MAG: DEAD/DEAH box helicase family protein [Nitrososphaerota archaeon]
MTHVLLQRMVEAIPNDYLPPNWADFDLASFSAEKKLWDYQQRALQNALKALCKYYEDFVDYQPQEDLSRNDERKRELWKWYRDNGLEDNLTIDLSRLNYRIANILREYYEADGDRIDYRHFINRMSFWMATGSGKTLVIVKLIEILARLVRRGEIPPCDILFLTHRDDLLEQLKRHVEEFNQGHSNLRIVLRELREYASVRRETLSLFRDQEVTVFYYRSDNLSDEQKEKIIDFRNYDNDGRWYVLLDEAHKGDKEESKRQHLYAILSRNGFLFNFSATFTDPRDIATTVFNFNLSEYIRAGYGKHIAILKQEMRAFRHNEDYTDDEKQKVVLKALLMLAYVHKAHKTVQHSVGDGFYHRPLMLVLVNSVNTEDADLQLFFRELERIAQEGVNESLWHAAKNELWEELQSSPSLMFEEDERLQVHEDVWQSLGMEDVLREVFNAERHGAIEVLVRPSNRQEVAFKLKTSDRPFALIKIGDISNWLKEKLRGYEINERFEDESYFVRLNNDESDITILMGSRTFYEGWDSNRPNLICYINIGVGEDAHKFVLQSVGRGARIEPIKNKRKRLLYLYNSGELKEALFQKLKDKVQPLETLIIFATNRQALRTVIEGLKRERKDTGEQPLPVFDINPEVRKKKKRVSLLVPVYKSAGKPLAEYHEVAKFGITKEEFRLLKCFVNGTDDRVLLMLADTVPENLQLLRRSLREPDRFYKQEEDGRRPGDLLRLLHRVLKWWTIVPEEAKGVKELEDEIRHFRYITVTLTDISELERKAKAVKEYPDRARELQSQYGTLPPAEFIERAKSLRSSEEFDHDGKKIAIKHIAQHYYLPVILSEDERVDYIRHIIKTPSEVRFVKDLETYVKQEGNKFGEFDWWFFSKLDESLDEIYIPYYDPKTNRIARFKPDFIFWLKKNKRYFIVFVDPKGMEHVDWARKVDGYCAIFQENGKAKTFQHKRWAVTVHLLLHTADVNKVPQNYRIYWFDTIDTMLNRLLSTASSK